MNKITIGLDTAKSVFHLVFKNTSGRILKKKKLKRHQVLHFFANQQDVVVAMEACGASHYWSRKISECGHEVKAIPPQHVAPFRKGNKSDYNDAIAIAEAAMREDMRFVPVKSEAQQDIQLVHRVRERLIGQRTALSNQVRGLLAEYGIVFPKGLSQLTQGMADILTDDTSELSQLARDEFQSMWIELNELESRIKRVDKQIAIIAKENAVCQRLLTMAGVGPVIATAMFAAIGKGEGFDSGRHLAAWLGLVPGQHSTGDKPRLLGITKRGNTYMRTQLINGARAALRHVSKKEDKVSLWSTQCLTRMSFNKACVALANKMARMAWAMLNNEQDYRYAGTD